MADESQQSSDGRNRRSADDALEPSSAWPSKRAKEDPIRPRASRACDRCKARKTRCSGTWPCVFCSHLKVECQFTAVHRRAPPLLAVALGGDDVVRRRSSIADDDAARAQDASASPRPLVQASHSTTTIDTTTDTVTHGQGRGPQIDAETSFPTSQLQSMRNSPEPVSQTTEGHYIGPASGVSFLLRVQRKLPIQSPGHLNSSIFNFGDRPLPGLDASFVILPPKPLAEAMLKRYFDFAATTHRFLHRPSMEAWLEELYETDGAMRSQDAAHSRKALLFMIFAHSNNYGSSSQVVSHDKAWKADPAELSARYFAVAEHQLSIEKGEIQLATVQARLAQCFYLLTQSRLNHCWTLFGITSHLILALGLHRKSRASSRGGHGHSGNNNSGGIVDWVELESRKRTFWCAYNLNTYLSIALGRPMTFHDDDIDQDLPVCVDDEQLRASPTPPTTIVGPSITSATVAQIRLSRILSQILRALYGIRTPSTAEHFTLAAKFTRDLAEWREHISYLLDTDGSSAIFVRLVLRQRDVLKLAFWHAQILVHRPFLLKAFSSLASDEADNENGIDNSITPQSAVQVSRRKAMQENVKICIDAATNITEHIDRIHDTGELYSTLFFIPYYGFSAVVALYVYAIQKRSSPPETYLAHFRSASKCHNQLKSIATRGSLMQRYGVVLEELRIEVFRHNPSLAAIVTPGPVGDDFDMEPQPQTNGLLSFRQHQTGLDGFRHGDKNGNSLAGMVGDMDQGALAVPGSRSVPMDLAGGDLTHMTSWGLFDSLATGGLGTLDSLLQGEMIQPWDDMNHANFGG